VFLTAPLPPEPTVIEYEAEVNSETGITITEEAPPPAPPPPARPVEALPILPEPPPPPAPTATTYSSVRPLGLFQVPLPVYSRIMGAGVMGMYKGTLKAMMIKCL
jgi:hypothetical protein